MSTARRMGDGETITHQSKVILFVKIVHVIIIYQMNSIYV